MFTRSVAHNWIAPIKSAEGQGSFPRRAHACFSPLIRWYIIYVYILYIYIYHPPWKFNILQEQIIWTVTPALYFLPLRECRLVLRVYHYPITMGYEDVWLYFPGWNWRYNLPCQRKLLYPRCRARCRFTIGGEGGGGEGMDCWKLRVTICQNWINGRNGCRGRVLAMMLNSRYAFGNEYRF